jgi:hypothetical protein
MSDSQTALSDVERIAASFRDLAAAGVPVSKGHAAKITRALVARLPPLSGWTDSRAHGSVPAEESLKEKLGTRTQNPGHKPGLAFCASVAHAGVLTSPACAASAASRGHLRVAFRR